MSFDAEVLADSVSPAGVRITTVKATYPRFIHAEWMTHRLMSRSAGSSRAIPTEKQIAAVRQNPYTPEEFNERVKGMGYGDPLDEEQSTKARAIWRRIARGVTDGVEELNAIGIDKSRANRPLEAWAWMTSIWTATEWSNLFALRQPQSGEVPQRTFPAQPEFQVSARMVGDVIAESTPKQLRDGQWHTPLAEYFDVCDQRMDGRAMDGWEASEAGLYLAYVSAGRCAPISYGRTPVEEHPNLSYGRTEQLAGSAHWSPLEHAAKVMTVEDTHNPALWPKMMVTLDTLHSSNLGEPFNTADVWCGNVRGFVQLRKMFPNEHDAGLELEKVSSI